MRSCLTMNAEDGYREARRLLKERYGQDYKIASAYIDRVTTGPPIRAERVDDLRKFSILITSCKNALKDIGYLRRINNPDVLKKIVDRLPFDMKRKWRDIADDISECKHREITIEDVASFIEKKSKIRFTSGVWRHSQSEIDSKPSKISKTTTPVRQIRCITTQVPPM